MGVPNLSFFDVLAVRFLTWVPNPRDVVKDMEQVPCLGTGTGLELEHEVRVAVHVWYRTGPIPVSVPVRIRTVGDP